MQVQIAALKCIAVVLSGRSERFKAAGDRGKGYRTVEARPAALVPEMSGRSADMPVPAAKAGCNLPVNFEGPHTAARAVRGLN